MSADALAVAQQGLWLAAWLLAPVLAAGALAGVVAGALRGLTGWQEATLSHVSRVVLVALGWALAAPWIARSLVRFTTLAWGGPP